MLKKYWLDRVKQFANNFFKGNVEKNCTLFKRHTSNT